MIREVEFGILDYSNEKCIKFTVKKGEPSLEDIEEYFGVLHEVLDSIQGNFVFVFDATAGKWVDNKVRIAMGKKGVEFEKKYAERFKKNYLVIPNMILKTMLRGVNLVNKPKVEQLLFSKLGEAEAAALKEIEGW